MAADQSVNKSQTIPYLSSYSYAAAANRSYRNSDTKHSYQFVTNRQHYHHNAPTALAPASSPSPTPMLFATQPTAKNSICFSPPKYIRSSMTMPAIYRNMTSNTNTATTNSTPNSVYSSNRSYRNTSLHTFLVPPIQLHR